MKRKNIIDRAFRLTRPGIVDVSRHYRCGHLNRVIPPLPNFRRAAFLAHINSPENMAIGG